MRTMGGASLPAGTSRDYPVGPYPTAVTSKVTKGKVVPVTTAFWSSRYLGSLQVRAQPRRPAAAQRLCRWFLPSCAVFAEVC